jgi:opacity protein-like surface antigen
MDWQMKKILPLTLTSIAYSGIALWGITPVSHAAPGDYCGSFVTLGLNGALPRPNTSHTLNLQPDVRKTYTSNTSKEVIFIGELFGGWQNGINLVPAVDFFGQLGLTLSLSNEAKIQGNIWEDANPVFSNFKYDYKLTHAGVGVKSKLFMVAGNVCDIYLSGGVGLGFNQARRFNIAPLIIEEVPAPLFTSKSTTSFAYSAGIGAQTALTRNWKASLGYEFNSWGKSELGRAPGQSVGSGLKLDHFYVSSVNLSFTYVV